jgi:hypothetical protein
VLIFTMQAAVLALHLIVGRRKLRRADRIEAHCKESSCMGPSAVRP